MRHLLRANAALPIALLASAALDGQARTAEDFERLPYAPRETVCYRAPARPTIDGRLDEPAWKSTAWSVPFVDIDGVKQPGLSTRVKMLWDDERFYVGAELEEPHVWGTLRERDSVIFQDNDFELFLDPDGDTHAYYELEVNALNTVWDLMLHQPYRDGGPAIHAWDIAGLQSAVHVRGTINQPSDRDEAWTVEIAMPWKVLSEAAPRRAAPRNGDQWRVNFSRVQWQTEVRDGKYVKRIDPGTGKPFPEDNWVWSPQGAVNMHMPERWGIVQFSDAPAGGTPVRFERDLNDRVKWELRRLYYRQRDYRAVHGRYAASLADLQPPQLAFDGQQLAPSMLATESLYEISARGNGAAVVHIRQDGKVWVTTDAKR